MTKSGHTARNRRLSWPRVRRTLLGLAVLGTLIGFSVPLWVNPAVAAYATFRLVNSADYKATHGKWDIVPIPDANKINAIHQALLPTGKVLLIAGSGNDADNFKARSFTSLVYDPATGKSRVIPTPDDMFCSGHAALPNGNLLVAGGTQNYEILKQNQTRAGGVLVVSNDSHSDITLPKGTRFTGAKNGLVYETDAMVVVPKAYRNQSNLWQASDRNVYVAAVKPGPSGIYDRRQSFTLDSPPSEEAKALNATAAAVNMDKKEYEGISASYEFNPFTETYVPVSPMHYARWYPTLTSMSNGHVMAMSGLDGAGQILNGQTEIYDPATHQWTERKDLQQFFPTYPSVFLTANPNRLFSAGPSTGYGPADKGRTPGFWDLRTNAFRPVGGLRDPQYLETGTAAWLGPVNDQKMVVIGGGGVGDTDLGTGRIDAITLTGANPAFSPLASLPQVTRYPSAVALPTGNLFITGGSTGYRGRHASDILRSYMLDYQSGALTRMADPTVGRDYHGSALLLGNGQILTAGGDPLYGDKNDSTPGKFEQRIEIYTPPYLFNRDGTRAAQPALAPDGHPGSITDGQTVTLTLKGNPEIAHVRLLHPGAVTHVTDTNQRIVELAVHQHGGTLSVTLPANPALTPPGYYMLFLVDTHGVPSSAAWIQVGHQSGAGSQPAATPMTMTMTH